MYFIDEIAYAGEPVSDMAVIDLKVVNDSCLLVIFNTKEQRIFDCTELFQYPVYKKLLDQSVFNTVAIDHGIIVWEDGKLDISPEKVYKMSYMYTPKMAI